MTTHLDNDLVVMVSQDLEVACSEGIMPELLSLVSDSGVDMTGQDKFAVLIPTQDELLLEPVELLISFIELERGVIIIIHVLIVQAEDRDGWG